MKVFYFLQDVPCGLRDETHTALEWMGEFNLADSEKCFIEWSVMLEKLCSIIKDLEQAMARDFMIPVYNALLSVICLRYVGGIGFMEQFRHNADEALQMLTRLKEILTAEE